MAGGPITASPETVGAWLDAALDRPDWAGLVVWQALGDCPFTRAEDQERFTQAQQSMMARAEERMGLRQQAGEVTGEITSGFALLVTYAVILAPITMPQLVRDIFGEDPLSPAVRQQPGVAHRRRHRPGNPRRGNLPRAGAGRTSWWRLRISRLSDYFCLLSHSVG
jgi:hypothetical protein